MPITTRQPTANETPDSGQGGSAVTGNINTGHGSTTSAASNGTSQLKTCRWSGFQPVSGIVTGIVLKAGWSENGSLSGVGASNLFRAQYSVNGGANWTDLFSHAGVTAVANGTAQATIPANTAIGQIQVRDNLSAVTVNPGETADVIGTVSDIRLEVTTQDQQVIVMM